MAYFGRGLRSADEAGLSSQKSRRSRPAPPLGDEIATVARRIEGCLNQRPSRTIKVKSVDHAAGELVKMVRNLKEVTVDGRRHLPIVKAALNQLLRTERVMYDAHFGTLELTSKARFGDRNKPPLPRRRTNRAA